MKRDWELVREILLKIEAHPAESRRPIDERDFPGREPGSLREHVGILKDAGLVKAVFHSGGFAISRLTWEGHDFLDAIRSEGAMRVVKEKAATVGGGLTFEMVKAIGTAYVKSKLGL